MSDQIAGGVIKSAAIGAIAVSTIPQGELISVIIGSLAGAMIFACTPMERIITNNERMILSIASFLLGFAWAKDTANIIDWATGDKYHPSLAVGAGITSVLAVGFLAVLKANVVKAWELLKRFSFTSLRDYKDDGKK